MALLTGLATGLLTAALVALPVALRTALQMALPVALRRALPMAPTAKAAFATRMQGSRRHAAGVGPLDASPGIALGPVLRQSSSPALLPVFLLGLALGPVSVCLAGTPPRIEATTSVRSIAVGDTFRLDFAISWEEGTEIKPLAVPDKIGDFIIKDVSEVPVALQGEANSKSLSLVLTTFETGAKSIPPISFVYVGADGAVATVETAPIDIEVESLLPEDAADLRDIKRPLEVPKRWKDMVLSYLLIVGLAVGAAASVLVSFKRREEIEAYLRRVYLKVCRPVYLLLMRLLVLLRLRRPARIAAFDVRIDEPGLVPSEAALKELDRIEALGLAQRGMIKELYTLVSETLRRYLERQYGVLAMESPTSYTLAALEETGLLEASLVRIQEVLVEADWVKFAKHTPDASAVASLIGRSREIVRVTAQASQAGVAGERLMAVAGGGTAGPRGGPGEPCGGSGRPVLGRAGPPEGPGGSLGGGRGGGLGVGDRPGASGGPLS